jgi:hypothetical protein
MHSLWDSGLIIEGVRSAFDDGQNQGTEGNEEYECRNTLFRFDTWRLRATLTG